MSTLTTELVGEAFNGEYKWRGDGVVASNGSIYFAPYDANRVLKYDTSTSISTLVGEEYGDGGYKWDGGVFANNSVYFAPASSKKVLKVDINTDTTQLIGPDYDGNCNWGGGVLGEDGFVYFVPYNAKQILRIDPKDDTCELIGDKYDGSCKWIGGVVATNNIIYCIPYDSSKVLKFDPTTKVAQLISTDLGDGGSKYCGGTIGSDGCVYAPPMDANRILKINPNNDEITLVGSDYQKGCAHWSSFVQGYDNCLYGIPFCANNVVKYDVHSQTSSLVGSRLGGHDNTWLGGILGPDNCIYGTPYKASQVLKISMPNGPTLSSDGFIPTGVGNSANEGTGHLGYEDIGNNKPIAAGIDDSAKKQEDDSTTNPAMWAMTYNQLLEVKDLAEATFKKDFESKTMRDINKEIIKPVCQRNKTSYALSKNSEGLKINVFVSHSWDEPFGEFVNAIQDAFQNKLEKPNLWICAFALLQGNAEDIATQLGTDDTALDQSPFVQALKGADSYLIVRNSKKDLCARIWCICEFTFAKKYGFIPSKTLVAGPSTFADVTTSVYHAESFDPKDKDKILKELLDEHSREEIDEYMNQFRAFGIVGSAASKITSTGVDTIPAPKPDKLSITDRLNRLSMEVGVEFKGETLSTSKKLEVMEIDYFDEKQSGSVMVRIKKFEEELDIV